MDTDVFIRMFLGGGAITVGMLAVLAAALTVASVREHRGPTAALAGTTTVFAGVASVLAFLLYDSLTLW